MSNRLFVVEAEQLARCIEHGAEPVVRANLYTRTAALLDAALLRAEPRRPHGG